MPKNWFISTTVHSPERLRDFLFVLQDMQGRTWDNDAQVEYQIRLIQAKGYGVGNGQFCAGLEQKYIEIIVRGTPFSFDDASRIFHSKKYKNAPRRGHALFSPLQKLGFAVLRDNAVYITDMGKLFLAESDDYGEVFLRSLLKWQFPNPLDRGDSSAQHYGIKPFVGTLRLIDAVNKIWAAKGEKPKGLSVKEFVFFALNLDNWRRIDTIAESIVNLRQKIAKKPESKRDEYFRAEASKVIKGVKLHNIRDYQNNAICYFRMTKYFRLHGWEYIDLEPMRKIELESLFKRDNAAPLPEFAVWNKQNKGVVRKKYLDYLGSAKTPVIPGKTKSELLASIRLIQREIRKIERGVFPADMENIT